MFEPFDKRTARVWFLLPYLEERLLRLFSMAVPMNECYGWKGQVEIF